MYYELYRMKANFLHWMKLASTVNCKFNLFCGFYDLIFLMLLLGEYCSFLLLINSGHIGSCILSYWVLKKYDSCTQAKKNTSFLQPSAIYIHSGCAMYYVYNVRFAYILFWDWGFIWIQSLIIVNTNFSLKLLLSTQLAYLMMRLWSHFLCFVYEFYSGRKVNFL